MRTNRRALCRAFNVEVYGNRGIGQLPCNPRPWRRMPLPSGPDHSAGSADGPTARPSAMVRLLPPDPAGAISRQLVGERIASSLGYYSKLVRSARDEDADGGGADSGTFGQGFPGLVYLSTHLVSRIRPQRPANRCAVRNSIRSFFSDLMVAHEVAHQWWGNVVIISMRIRTNG